MKCPNCKDVNLVMTDRNGIEIDYCPECRGVWLDRGELDKIIERSQQEEQEARFLPQSVSQSLQGTPPSEPVYAQPSSGHHDNKRGTKHGHSAPQPGHGGGWRDGYQNGHQNQSRHQEEQVYHKKSFLREIFD